MKCIFCNSKSVETIYIYHLGYNKRTAFDIFKCKECGTHFISIKKVMKKIYEKIYLDKDTSSYNRYYKYSKRIKNYENPLRYLAKEESCYYPIQKYLKDKSNLDILEIGCGRGYLTYSLRCLGHKAIGIDISKNAINYATKNFGKFFFVGNAESFIKKENKKYDLIIATELIEHLSLPGKFIKNCLKLLKRNGKIIITTPNKDYSKKTAIWQTDPPPLHTAWFGHKSFRYFAKINNLKIKFFDFKDYFPHGWNNLINFIIDKRESISYDYQKKISLVGRIIKFLLIDFAVIRYPSSRLHNLLSKEYPSLCVFLNKSNL